MKTIRLRRSSSVLGRFVGCRFGLPLLLFLPFALLAQAATPNNVLVVLVDTSDSMNENQKLANFRVEMINLVQSSIPIDGSWRIRIYSFDRGLSSKTFDRVLANDKDKTDAQLFLNSLQAKGSVTWLFQSLDKVLAQVETATAQGEAQDVAIHVFTDGDNNGGGLSFKQNVDRFVSLRKSRAQGTEFFYHAMEGYNPPPEIRKSIDPAKGVFLVQGVRIPPKIKIKPLDFAPSTLTPIRNVATKVLGSVEKWEWDFGDNTPPSNEEAPTHQYQKPGEYLVICTASNSSGSGSDRGKIVVRGVPPAPDFETDEAAADGLLSRTNTGAPAGIPIQFRDKSKGSVDARSWDFGDGQPASSDTNPVHWYAKAGTYTVILNMQNQSGTNAVSKRIQVAALAAVGFHWSPLRPKYGQEVEFINDSVGELAWNWSLGNGQTSTEKNPKTTYAKQGNYPVQLAGGTRNGRQLKVTKTIEIQGDQPPKASFILSRTNLTVGEEIVCTDTSTGAIAAREWVFGDGAKSKDASTAHLYAQPGTFRITLTVTGAGGTDSYSATVLIQPAVMTFEFSPAMLVEGEPARFINRSQGPFKSWVWKVDGVVIGTNHDADYTFAKPGTHTIELTGRFTAAAGPAGASLSFPAPLFTNMTALVVPRPLPKIGFALLVDGKTIRNGQVFTHPAPASVQLTNLSTGSIQSWLWDLGDGTTNNLVSPTHKYQKKGRYRVSLTLKSSRGEVVESAGDHYIWVEVTGWRPPARARWPFLGGLALFLYLVWWKSPLGLRGIRYQVEGKPKGHRSWKRDLTLNADNCTATVRMRRSLWLRKYFTVESKNSVQWLDYQQHTPRRAYLRSRDILVLGQTKYELRFLNQSRATAYRSCLIILTLVTATWWFTRNLFY